MNCPRCKSQNPETAAFCDQCGTSLETACPSCGEANRRGAKFCKKCGESSSRAAVATQRTAAHTSAPQPPIPKHLAEKILAERHTIEGERKQVTILFADIKDSTRLVEGRDPEQAQKLLDPILKAMMDAVHRYEGTVSHILGDGIMALFGAPLAHEDHAVRACYAALAMQQQLRHYADEIGPSDELPQIRIGLNSGEVVVRTIGNDLNLDYLAVGDSIHLASRMEELAAPGAILMTARTLREVEGFVQVNSLGLLQAKGFAQLIEGFELTGVTAVRKRLHAAVARGLSGFVGRRTEIEVFKRVLQQASSGHGQILALCGEAGMGKSRLVYEFTHSHLSPEWAVLEATSASYGKATPYYPLIELLRRYFQLHEGESPETIRLKVQTHLTELNARLKDAIPPLLALLDVLPDAEAQAKKDSGASNGEREFSKFINQFENLEPQQRRRLTFEALKGVFIRESIKQPVLLLMEDLHWIDNETQAFLDYLVESLPMNRLLLLVNYRPGYSHTWSDKSYYTQIRVDPLSDQGAEELLRILLGDNEDLGPLKELLIKRTEGNPFFVEESVRSLVESGSLTGIKGQYRPGLKIDSIRIPSTVQTVLADRIDRLPAIEKHLLQTASAIGVIVPMALLQAVAGLPEDELYRHLATLRSSEFLYESNLFPDLEYTFKHALTNEVVYGAMLHNHKSLLHARIVNALEQSAGEISHDHIEKLAHHAFHGELWQKAVFYLRQASAIAMGRSANKEAVVFLERARDALQKLPDSREKFEQSVDVRLELRNVLFLLGEFGQIQTYLTEARSIAESLGDLCKLRFIWNAQLSYFSLTGEPDRVIELGKRALAPGMACEDPQVDVVTHYYMGIAYYMTADYGQAMNVLRQSLAMIDAAGLSHDRLGTSTIVSVVCRNWLVHSLAQTGSFSEGVVFANEGVRIAKEVNHPYSLAYMTCGLGFLFLLKGDLKLAIELFQQCEKLCQDANIRVLNPQITAYLGLARALSGHNDEALPLLELADDQTMSIGRFSGHALRVAWLSESYLMSGRLSDARVHAKRALDLADRLKERGHGAWSLKVLGDLAAYEDPAAIKEGKVYLDRALAAAIELGMRPLEAHCHLSQGKLYLRTSDFYHAEMELNRAAEIYRLLQMNFWLEQTEKVRSCFSSGSDR